MSSLPPFLKPYSLQVAERIHTTTGKDRLPRVIGIGLACECGWHAVIERRLFKTPRPKVIKAVAKAFVFWPSLYLATRAVLTWAEWRVKQAERAEKENRPAQ